jgi:hypothetical protein
MKRHIIGIKTKTINRYSGYAVLSLLDTITFLHLIDFTFMIEFFQLC